MFGYGSIYSTASASQQEWNHRDMVSLLGAVVQNISWPMTTNNQKYGNPGKNVKKPNWRKYGGKPPHWIGKITLASHKCWFISPILTESNRENSLI